MLSLFEERAKALRKYILELMTQKQTELEFIREEFRPRFDLLKERRIKGLINDEQYRQQVEELNKEESNKKVDAEIAIGELEQKMEEEITLQASQAKSKAEELLKDRQTKEKKMMYDLLMRKTHKDNDTIKSYLEKEKKEAEREL